MTRWALWMDHAESWWRKVWRETWPKASKALERQWPWRKMMNPCPELKQWQWDWREKDRWEGQMDITCWLQDMGGGGQERLHGAPQVPGCECGWLIVAHPGSEDKSARRKDEFGLGICWVWNIWVLYLTQLDLKLLREVWGWGGL